MKPGSSWVFAIEESGIPENGMTSIYPKGLQVPLDMGTLEGYILTCPMHHSQFDIITGEALSEPVHADFGDEIPQERILKYLQYIGMLMEHIRTCDIKSYPVEIHEDSIRVDVEEDECCI